MVASIEKPDVQRCVGSRPRERDSDRLFYRRSWVRMEPPAVVSAEPSRWMIFLDSVGLGNQISAQLRGAQHQVIEVRPGNRFARVRKGQYVIRPACRADYDALIVDVAKCGIFPHRIIHLWSVCHDSARTSLDETLNLSFYSLLNLAQAVKDQGLSGLDIAVVSNRLQSVSTEPIIEPARATMHGVARVIQREMPEITCRAIDCDPMGQGTGYVAVQIITEHLASFTDPVVAYRGDERWRENLERLDLRGAASHPRLKHGGTYLITGGLDRWGLRTAESLARDFHAQLILVDQMALPPCEEWEGTLQRAASPEHARVLRKLSEIKSLGCEVIAICADATRHDEMVRAIELARLKFGSINGVIHAAGLSEDKSLQMKAQGSTARILDTKIKATLVLEDVLSKEPLDFFALFSSLDSVIPCAGRIDEAAASAFLDAFASSPNDRCRVAIAYESWREAGVAPSVAEQRSESVGNRRPESTERDPIEAEETPGILPSEGTKALTQILSTETPSTVVVCAQDLLALEASARGATKRAVTPSASREDVEGILLEWWREFSQSGQVSLDDDFFALGGNSLAGVQLFTRIKTAYGLNLGLATLFEAPTIRQLARLIRESSGSGRAKPQPWSPVVPIQPKGSRPPLYVISGLGGNVIKFHSLAFHLGETQPMYGLLPRGLDGKDSFLTRIEDMATYYMEAIRTVQSDGPYCLAGYSFGGIVAFEVAQQIVARGGTVNFLGLFDTIEWHYAERVDRALRPGERIEVIKEHLRSMAFSPERFTYFKSLLNAKISQLKYRLFPSRNGPLPQEIGDLEEVNSYAAANYYPKPFPGKITLFRSTKRAVQHGSDEYLGWGDFAAGGLEVHHVGGTHFNILQEPEVRTVAEKLRLCLA